MNRVVIRRFVGNFGIAGRDFFIPFVFVDQLHGGDHEIVLIDVDDANALRVPSDRADVGDVRADDHPLFGDQQYLIVLEDVGDTGHLAVLVGGLDVRDTDATARLQAVGRDRGALAEALFRD